MNKHIVNVQATLVGFFAIGFFQAGHVMAQVSTPVVGFVTTTLAANSDTIIAPQVFRPAELNTPVSGLSSSAGQATLTLGSGSPSLTADQFKYVANTQPKVYVARVTSGNLQGYTFTITANTQTTITIDLDGLSVSSADITGIEVSPCWSLKTLFPASDAGVSFTASVGVNNASRRTQLLLPNFSGTGINRPASTTYFFNPAVNDWVSTTATTTPAGETSILPGQYLIHRNIGGSPSNLAVTVPGGVLSSPFRVYLGTLTTGLNDNPLALPRPTDYLITELGLNDGNFVQSSGLNNATRRDTLLVINPTGAGINRPASTVYFRFNNNWYSTANTSVTANTAVIPAGAAVYIRKFASDGLDKEVVNQLNVSL